MVSLAADKGNANAEGNLGYVYENGWGVSQDYAEAAKWYRKAADQGIADAQANLGAMYELGNGVLQDYVLAYMWLNLAAAKRAEFASIRDLVAQSLTSTQIAQAHLMLVPLLGTSLAGVLFAVALLASGQSSTLTGTFAGQIVMEGFLDLRMSPWLRRLVTRSLAIVRSSCSVGAWLLRCQCPRPMKLRCCAPRMGLPRWRRLPHDWLVRR